MKFEFAPASTVELKHVPVMNELETHLNSFFQSKSYGEDLKEVRISIVVVNPRLERFFKHQKPSYTPTLKNPANKSKHRSVEKALKYSINLNFECFNNASETEAREMLKKELMSSISLFDRLKNKIKDFNVTPFRQDMGQFIEEACA